MPVKSLRFNLKIKILSRMSYKSRLNYEWSLLRSTVDCWLSIVNIRILVGHHLLFSMNFFFKSLQAKCLSSPLATKRLEIAALCMVCAVLSVFVRVILLPVLINLCHFNTARPHVMLFFSPIFCVFTMARSPSSLFSHSRVSPKSATPSSAPETTSASLPMN